MADCLPKGRGKSGRAGQITATAQRTAGPMR